MSGGRSNAPILEALAALAVTFPLAVGLHLPELWLLVPLAIITLAQRSYAEYGLSWEQPGRWRFHLGVVVFVFVPYVIGHYLFARYYLHAAFHLRVPPQFGRAAVDQLLAVGLPEEFFFRGYLQTQCDQVWGHAYRFAGARWGWGLPLAAGLFALCHIFYGGPARLIVFFPGLLYGWLRARTGTIAVPAVYHAASNLLMTIMLASLA